MKTKKEILDWWVSRGTKEATGNDYKDFWEKIDKQSCMIDETIKGTGEKQEHKIVIMKKNWKFPIQLFFYDLECYRIIGF